MSETTTTTPSATTLTHTVEGRASTPSALLTMLFWIWGGGGLIGYAIMFLNLPSNVGVGTSAYLTAAALLWIGGMILFGIGALLVPSSHDLQRVDHQSTN